MININIHYKTNNCIYYYHTNKTIWLYFKYDIIIFNLISRHIFFVVVVIFTFISYAVFILGLQELI